MWGKQVYKEYTNMPLVGAPPTYVLLGLSVMSTLSAQVVAYPLYSVKVNLQAGTSSTLLIAHCALHMANCTLWQAVI